MSSLVAKHYLFPEKVAWGSLTPFDPLTDSRATALCLEEYLGDAASPGRAMLILKELYYLARPLLPVHLRRVVQRRVLASRRRLDFPSWPVDTSVEKLSLIHI